MESNKLCKKLYDTSNEPYIINTTKWGKSMGNELYGEITYEGTTSLIKYFNTYFTKNTVFYDLGSGLGKMVIHMGNLIPGIKKSTGIEYSKERYQYSLEVLNNNKDLKNKTINLINGDIFKTDISDATVCYMDNTVMSSTEHGNVIWNLIPQGCLFIFAVPFGWDSIINKHTSQLRDIGYKKTYGKQDWVSYAIKS